MRMLSDGTEEVTRGLLTVQSAYGYQAPIRLKIGVQQLFVSRNKKSWSSVGYGDLYCIFQAKSTMGVF